MAKLDLFLFILPSDTTRDLCRMASRVMPDVKKIVFRANNPLRQLRYDFLQGHGRRQEARLGRSRCFRARGNFAAALADLR
jgi:hypothetical protein